MPLSGSRGYNSGYSRWWHKNNWGCCRFLGTWTDEETRGPRSRTGGAHLQSRNTRQSQGRKDRRTRRQQAAAAISRHQASGQSALLRRKSVTFCGTDGCSVGQSHGIGLVSLLSVSLTIVRDALYDRPCRVVVGWWVTFVNCG